MQKDIVQLFLRNQEKLALLLTFEIDLLPPRYHYSETRLELIDSVKVKDQFFVKISVGRL